MSSKLTPVNVIAAIRNRASTRIASPSPIALARRRTEREAVDNFTTRFEQVTVVID